MKNWYNEIPKRLHQSRIGEDIKRSIRTLSIVESQRDKLHDWHQQQSRVV